MSYSESRRTRRTSNNPLRALSRYRQFMGRLNRGEERRMYNILLGLPIALSYPVALAWGTLTKIPNNYVESQGINEGFLAIPYVLLFFVAVDGGARLFANRSYYRWNRDSNKNTGKEERRFAEQRGIAQETAQEVADAELPEESIPVVSGQPAEEPTTQELVKELEGEQTV